MEHNYWQLGSWRRTPVAMHWTVLLVPPWLYLLFWDLLATLVGSLAFFALLVVHELGHVFVLRRRRIPVESVTLYGLHGETRYGFASPRDESLVAWGGVAAQLLVLVLAVAAAYLMPASIPALVSAILGPLYFIFVKVNIILMVVVLLPIGPFDGRAAWAAIPQMRAAARKRKRQANERKLFPETALSPEKRRELEESSAKAAEEVLKKFSGKSGEQKRDG